uniref:Fucosyltransferase n=1 Tax=Tetraodon nigroviridis TaxID=99883 RepID=Q6EV17_TETNG|nr:alpha3-fucosyltransferase [Tetraodon nigroviridis]
MLFLLLCLLSLWFLLPWLRGPQAAPDRGGRNLTVLLWSWPFNKPLSLEGDVCWDMSGIPGCRLLSQRSLFSTADVVVFHSNELEKQRRALPFDLPRPQGQRWAWMSLEAPAATPDLRRYSNVFNMTVSYRRDADVTIPYGQLQPRETAAPTDAVPANKTFPVCWVVSNYQTRHRRSKVFQELKAVIPVQVYGRWSRKPLSAGALLPTISRCYFYLAFENAISKDYITEKLWRNAYLGGAVPVVLGPPLKDYQAVAPPRSFIHVDNFTSTRELALHLRQLAADQRRYREYFSWRRDWEVKLFTDWRPRLCAICSQFSRLPQHRVYASLHDWVHLLTPAASC